MLTRLKVSGFKNLVDVDVRFGPFTCVAGVNGVGKSNLFDAIRFLAALADKTLLDAALAVRAERGQAPDVRGLFHRRGDQRDEQMRFETEMIVPPTAVDDLGKEGNAKTTILRYGLELAYRQPDARNLATGGGEFEITYEELGYIQKGQAREHLLFDHSPSWRDAAVVGARRSPLISTDARDGRTVIKLHQDGNQGRSSLHAAASLPRTVLSSGNASESPTVLCARREMASWRLLQLEPSALRKPSGFTSPTQLGTDGLNIAAALHHLARTAPHTGTAPDEAAVYCRIANRLSELIGCVDSVRVDRDEKRELLTLVLKELSGTELPARALSDGTLRFLALAVLEMDTRSGGVICLEEPENGIHPARIPAMLRLLQDVASDVEEEVDAANPLRQVIVNTHSPAVVGEAPDDSLLVAEAMETLIDGTRRTQVRFACLPDTWRADAPEKPPIVAKGDLLAYLNPRAISPTPPDETPQTRPPTGRRKVREHPDLQPLLPFREAL